MIFTSYFLPTLLWISGFRVHPDSVRFAFNRDGMVEADRQDSGWEITHVESTGKVPTRDMHICSYIFLNDNKHVYK